MKAILLILILFLATNSTIIAQQKILLVTGGHDFEEKEFFEMFDSFQGITYDWVIQPEANALINSDKIDEYTSVVFYDMYQDITEAQKKAYLKQLNEGKGMVFLHHSLVSYQNWSEFQSIIGGKYLLEDLNDHPKSTYKHDVDIMVSIVDEKHQILAGMNGFQLHDEVYGKYIINKGITPLIKTTHPESVDTIGWYHIYKNSRIVYLQPGHDHHAFESENYRSLVRRAILFVSAN